LTSLAFPLIPSLRSTLDEALDASLLLHIVDAAEPALRSHIQVTKEVLEGIGAGKLPSLLILNKIDAADISQKALLKKEFPEAIAMSALNPKDIEALHSRLVSFFLDNLAQVELVVPYGKEGVLADIHKNIQVLSESYEEKGVCLKRRTPAPLPP
jgi:GTP-binding protein HflX